MNDHTLAFMQNIMDRGVLPFAPLVWKGHTVEQLLERTDGVLALQDVNRRRMQEERAEKLTPKLKVERSEQEARLLAYLTTDIKAVREQLNASVQGSADFLPRRPLAQAWSSDIRFGQRSGGARFIFERDQHPRWHLPSDQARWRLRLVLGRKQLSGPSLVAAFDMTEKQRTVVAHRLLDQLIERATTQHAAREAKISPQMRLDAKRVQDLHWQLRALETDCQRVHALRSRLVMRLALEQAPDDSYQQMLDVLDSAVASTRYEVGFLELRIGYDRSSFTISTPTTEYGHGHSTHDLDPESPRESLDAALRKLKRWRLGTALLRLE